MFKLEYLFSKQIRHVDGFSNLIPKQNEPLKDSIIASLRTDSEIKTMICNTIIERPVTLHEIKLEANNEEFLTSTKHKITNKDKQIEDSFSICDDVLLYSERAVIPKILQKRI